jgi:subtilase family serine protease
VNGQLSFANAIEISVPEAISAMVLGFRGLENFRPQPRVRAAKPSFTSHQTGIHYLAPGDFATIYNIPAALDGTGQKIAVVGQTQINTSDIDAFRTAASLPPGPPPTLCKTLIPGGGTGFSTRDEVEANLDLEWSNAVAKNATIIYVYAGSNSASRLRPLRVRSPATSSSPEAEIFALHTCCWQLLFRDSLQHTCWIIILGGLPFASGFCFGHAVWAPP